MKIDPKLKQRVRFNQLDEEARTRLRRMYHFTSARAALQILQSGFIWSDDDSLVAHFAHSRSQGYAQAHSRDICMTFHFSGAAHLVDATNPSNAYAPNAMYVRLNAWPDMYGLAGMQVAEVDVSPGTASGLQCTGFTPSPDFLEQCKTDLDLTMVLTKLKRLGTIDRSVRVPASVEEREQIRKNYPPATFSQLDIWKMKWQLWQRRLQKRKSGSRQG